MSLLLAGLVLFLGSHSVRILADDWRARRIAALGSNGWKGIYSLVAVAGFVMIVYGYAEARQAPWCCTRRRSGPAIWPRC